MSRKNPILLFITACIPGCGQMYQGYMKRGVSLCAMFCVVILLTTFLYVGQLALLLPVVWLYAFFDTYNLRNRSEEQAAQNPDAYLFGLSSFDREQLSRLLNKRHSIIGWVLVALGGYGLLCIVGAPLFQWVYEAFDIDLDYNLPRLIVLLLVILLGIWFIRGPRKQPADDFTGFTPPPAAPQPVPADAAPFPGGGPAAQPTAAPASGSIQDGETRETTAPEEEKRHDGE